jgi:hypothetical protein
MLQVAVSKGVLCERSISNCVILFENLMSILLHQKLLTISVDNSVNSF